MTFAGCLRIVHLAGLALFVAQLADVPAIAADATKSRYRICPHTKAKFLRGNPCPCGHEHKKRHHDVRLVSAHADCDAGDDNDHARVPGFEAFVFIYGSELLLPRRQSSLPHWSHLFLPSGLSSDPPDIPS
ncbi:MAG: hypothetical protein JNJ69_00550 [Leptospiraceae bacterium]|nr:hypothetical protein [Leptospiraceae bacterium]